MSQFTQKNINVSVEMIEKMNQPWECTVQVNSLLNQVTCKIEKQTKEYKIIFPGLFDQRFKLGSMPNLKLECNDVLYFINEMLINHISFEETSGTISKFSTNIFLEKKDEYFYRLIVPSKKKENLTIYFDDCSWYQCGNNRNANLVVLNIDNKNFDLYIFENKEVFYYVIDCSEKINLEDFYKYCFSIFLSFGFMSGQLFQTEGYFLASKDKLFNDVVSIQYESLTDSIYSSFHPIWKNAYSFIQDGNQDDPNKFKGMTEQEAQEINPTLNGINSSTFSKICENALSSPDIHSAMYLMLEGSTLSLQAMASCFSVALEGITSFIYTSNDEKLFPIKNKDTKKNIIETLKGSFEEKFSKLNQSEKNFVAKKIDSINHPTNRDKLCKPFELPEINLNLNKADLEAIESRNRFLHGSTPRKKNHIPNSEMKPIDIEMKQVYYFSLKLYFLVTSLILKYAGFKGKVVNYPKIREGFTEIQVDEEYFREI
ncbi:MAG: hypothetical protein HQK65_00570 [Desulfamplus sp.]|nr:hypothetical protein [Desulfamplus sp.]